MNTAILIGLSLAGVSALAGLVYLLARFGASQAAKAAVADQIAKDERHAVETERKAGAVMVEHRTTDDAAKRMSDGSF